MIQDIITNIHSYISGYIQTPLGKFISSLWNIFAQVNGDPFLNNYGIRFSLMLFFAIYLLIIIQLRTRLIFDNKHLVAYIGILFLIFRILSMIGFEWGWQIGMYDDWILHCISPPLEHFWNMLFYGCIAYYTLNIYNYYPGILKKIIYAIPISFVSFFIYSTIQWKNMFIANLPYIMKYSQSPSDWQNHIIIGSISLYVCIVILTKYKKYYIPLTIFWVLTTIEHLVRSVCLICECNSHEMTTIYHAISIWVLPLLILHFITAYIKRTELPRERRMNVYHNNNELFIRCEDCLKPKLDNIHE